MFRVRFLIGLSAAALALVACSPKSDDMLVNTAETKMFETTQTYCFGRFLVDVPRETELRTSGHRYYGRSFETGQGAEEFKIKVASMIEKRKKKRLSMGQHLSEMNTLKRGTSKLL
jgi:hypothetical protein